MVVTKVTADYDRWTLLKSNEPLIIQLQARIRGDQCRKIFLSRLDYLRAHEQQAIVLQVYGVQCVVNIVLHTAYNYEFLQSHWKGSKQKKSYQERLDYLTSQAAVAVKVYIS